MRGGRLAISNREAYTVLVKVLRCPRPIENLQSTRLVPVNHQGALPHAGVLRCIADDLGCDGFYAANQRAQLRGVELAVVRPRGAGLAEIATRTDASRLEYHWRALAWCRLEMARPARDG